MARETLSADNLSDLLEREFQRYRATECVMVCRISPPIFREALKAGAANWCVEPPVSCPRNCHRLVEAAFARLAERYDVERPPAIPGSRARDRGEQSPS